MTEKRFQYNVNKNTIEQNGKFVAYMNSVDGVRIANKLNVFQMENEQLKKENLDLLEELDYYKSKCASLETGYIKAQDEGWRLEKSKMEFANELGRVIDENEELKQQISYYEKLITDKEVEWLRNNTVWEQMPTSKRTVTKTTFGGKND